MDNSDQANIQLRAIFRATVLASQLALRFAAHAPIPVANQIDSTEAIGRGIVVREGERQAAITFIQKWLHEHLSEYLKICDPYFAPEDMEALKMVLEVNPNCQVEVLTSLASQKKVHLDEGLDLAYSSHWRIRISDHEPPDTDIVVVGCGPSGTGPIHDRWWITQGAGLRFGTSFNSIGLGRTSEVTELEIGEVANLEPLVDQFLQRRRRDHNGDTIRYKVFTLQREE